MQVSDVGDRPSILSRVRPASGMSVQPLVTIDRRYVLKRPIADDKWYVWDESTTRGYIIFSGSEAQSTKDLTTINIIGDFGQ